MSETRGLQGLKAGDPIVIISSNPRNENARHRIIKTFGRTWVTTREGLRYSIETGEEAEHYGYQDRALTVAQWEEHAERRKLLAQLDRWGMAPRKVPAPERELTIAQLRQLAALLTEFELPPAPAPEDPDKPVRVRVSIEPRFSGIHVEVIEFPESEIAKRPASQSREDRIIELAEDYVNDVASWGATEIEDGDEQD